MMDHKAAPAELRDRCLGQQLVTEGGGHKEGGLEIDQRDANNAGGFEKLVNGHSSFREQGRGAFIEPCQILGKEHNAGGIAMPPFHLEPLLID